MATPKHWAEHLYATAQWPDARFAKRVRKIAAAMAARPSDSIPQACETWAATKATYRLLENDRIDAEHLIRPVVEATAHDAARQRCVLAIQDTTVLSFPRAHSTEGLGPINNTDVRGMFVHSTLALRDDGMALGLLGQQSWCRDPKRRGDAKHRRQRPFEEKESVKWVRGIDDARAALRDALPEDQRPRLIHIFDREGDIHEVFEAISNSDDGAVIRCAHNRRTHSGSGEIAAAHDEVRRAPLMATETIDVPRKRGQKARTASVELRTCRVHLAPNCDKHPGRRDLTLNLIEVLEPAPPDGATPLRWLLWTTESVSDRCRVLGVIAMYRRRWKIEEMHLALKSGCRIEEVRFESAARVAKAVALYTPVAVRIVALRDAGRLDAESPCTSVLSDDEWRALWTRIHRAPPSPRARPPSMGQAVQWIGRLGGHLGRKGDGMPGVRTLWRGLRDLCLLTEMYLLARR